MNDNDTSKRGGIRILAIFTAERGLCEEMLELLHEEENALTRMDMKKIISLSVKKQDLANRIMAEERLFSDEACALVPEQGEGPVSLSAVAKAVGGPEGGEIREAGGMIARLKEKIGLKNEVTREFIRSTLGYLGDAISILTGPVAEDTAYHGRGMKKGARRSPSMVSREV